MKLRPIYTGLNCEYEMQDLFANWLKEKHFKFVIEFTVKEVHRRADFLLLSQGRLVNVEAKYSDFNCMMRQLKDHSKYCDYCFAFIPNDIPTSIDFKKQLGQNKFGLIVFNRQTKEITEVLEAHYNKPENKRLKEETINKIREHKEKK